MKALILAAGYGTRLYPLTKEYPKPLLTIAHKPLINYLVDKIAEIDAVDEIFVVTNSKFIGHFRSWKRKIRSGKRITLIDDLTKNHSQRRGAVGDINFAIQQLRIKNDLLVIGGDNLFDGDLNDFLSFAKRKRPNPVIGIYRLDDVRHAVKYGVIKLDRHQQVVDFKEKPRRPHSRYVAMCLYFFPKGNLHLIEEFANHRKNKHDATGFYIEWLRKKTPIYGFVFDGDWYDIGDHDFYNEAKWRFLEREER